MLRSMVWMVVAGLAASGAVAGDDRGADMRGQWVFPPAEGFPSFTRLKIDGQPGRLRGTITSEWYGELPMLDLRAEGRQLRFKLDNGNPRITKYDLVLTSEKADLRLTGQLWYAQLNVTARRALRGELASPGFPIYPLPALRDVPDNGLARTPPMGWNSWNKFAEGIDDKTVREIADALVATGLRDAGYSYVNIDDGWQGVRDSSGVLQPNGKFTDMKLLADYVHSRGLKLGIYSSPGPKSCAGYPGSFGHVAQDARTWAAWGIDYLKYDLCSGEAFYRSYETVRAAYQEMGTALQATGRPIVFSLCEYGRFSVGEWGRKVGGNLWRTTGDISDDYATMAAIGFDKTAPAEHAGPGGWNDPDMLEVGNGGMSIEEYRAHMTLWALLAAPLLTGNDIRNMAPEALLILANREVIGIDQDPLGRQARRVMHGQATEVWIKPLADGSAALGLFNRSGTPTPVSLVWSELGLGSNPVLRDVWSGVDLGHRGGTFSAEIPAHGAILLKSGPHTADTP